MSEIFDECWTLVKGRLRAELGEAVYNTARISVPSLFLKSWIQSHYAEPFAVTPPASVPHLEKADTGHFRHERKPVSPSSKTAVVPDTRGRSPLDPRLTFETFMVGRSNTLAYAASKQAATARRGDPVMFNPLYIHTGVGPGKTHLLQAVLLKINSLYLTAERFTYGFAHALQSRLRSERRKFHEAEMSEILSAPRVGRPL
jgi:chromosomal replication initiator protein